MTSRDKLFTASLRHLKADPYLGSFVIRHGPIIHRRAHSRGTFRALAESIIYQQLSGKAADSICRRFVALFPKKSFPTPGDVLRASAKLLRSAGLSNQKARYVKDLAQKSKDGTIAPRRFSKMTDEEVVAHVTTVKGIGEWTAHMFLMFTLSRPDILPTGDLGIRKGFQKLFGLRSLPNSARMHKLAAPWQGHRTLACFYLWRLLDENA